MNTKSYLRSSAFICGLFPALLEADLSQWQVPAAIRNLGYRVEPRHEGCLSAACMVLLPPEMPPPGAFGNLTQSLDARPYRGRKVALSAWVRLEDAAPDDRAQLWMRVLLPDRQLGFYDDMGDRPIRSRELRRFEIAGEVAPEAVSIQIGVLSFGKARVWVDGAQLEAGAAETAEETAARREIQELYGRIDAAYARGDPAEMSRLALSEAQLVMGPSRSPLAAAIDQIGGEMRRGTKIESHSRVTGVGLEAGGAIVSVNNDSCMRGAYASRELISISRDTWVRTPAGWRLKQTALISSRAMTPPTDAATARAVAGEIEQRASPLESAGLAVFGKAVGAARIVALGEATYGAGESFQINRRLLQYLVREKGFTVLAIEANWPEALAVDRYIKTGDGDAREALAAMNFWAWYTQEMLELVEWMRSYNQAPGKHATLTCTSFDAQFGHAAADKALEYLKEYAPDLAAVAQAVFAEAYDIELQRGTLYDERAEAVATRVAGVLREFDVRHRELTTASGEEKWRDARQAAAIVQQACSLRIAGKGPGRRDEILAGNVEWLAGHAFPGEKMVVWAHNMHVGADPQPKSMGAFLRERFGRQLYTVGYAFQRGGLRAKAEGGTEADVTAFEAPPSPAGSGDAVLAAAGLSEFFLDLAGVPPAGPLGRWLAEPHLFHHAGSTWFADDPDANLEPAALAKRYDGLIFIEEAHAARPL